MMQFVNAPSLRVFILKGYAGTGKTTLMRFLIQELIKQDKGKTVEEGKGKHLLPL